MGKVDDYTAGRSQGLILAREIVKKTVSRDWRKKSSSETLQESTQP
jgi:hypothetical protein